MVMNHRKKLHFAVVTTWDFWMLVQEMAMSSLCILYLLTFLLLRLGVHIHKKTVLVMFIAPFHL